MYSCHCDGKNQCDIESPGDGGGDLETSPLSLAMFVLLAEQAGEGSILWYICILWYLHKDLEFHVWWNCGQFSLLICCVMAIVVMLIKGHSTRCGCCSEAVDDLWAPKITSQVPQKMFPYILPLCISPLRRVNVLMRSCYVLFCNAEVPIGCVFET